VRFLIDEDLPRSTADLLRKYGHEAVDTRDIGLRGANDTDISAYARDNGLILVTGDFDFSDIRNYPPKQYPGLVVLKYFQEFNRFLHPEFVRGFSSAGGFSLSIVGEISCR